MKNLVLIGFMGVGKTTLGKKAAKRLGYEFIDMDKAIEMAENRSIAEIFAQKGEAYFREREQQIAQDLSRLNHIVVATGGGVVKSPPAMKALAQNAVVVWLQASAEVIYRHTLGDDSRPLLEGENRLDRIRLLLEEREPLYRQFAQKTVVAEGPMKNTVSRIVTAWEEEQ